MEKVLQEFFDVCDQPYSWLAQRKNKQKLIACYPMYVPEEIIHAGGALPFTMQRSREIITLATDYLGPSYCDFFRSTFDLSLRDRLDPSLRAYLK